MGYHRFLAVVLEGNCPVLLVSVAAGVVKDRNTKTLWTIALPGD